MHKGKHIIFTVTNDLVYDQRMQRICSSMFEAGYQVTLVGRKNASSPPLSIQPFHQIRIPVQFEKGKLFYTEYNYKLYKYLIKTKADAICAIDLDTIVPVYYACKKLKIPKMYDAHEFFTEMIEVKRRPAIHFIWKKIEQWMLPKFGHGYTVGFSIAKEFKSLYGVDYAVVRNISKFYPTVEDDNPLPKTVENILKEFNHRTSSKLPIFLYQGAVNEGRALPELLEAMSAANARLIIAGTGNLFDKISGQIESMGLQSKVYLCGNVTPADLRYLTKESFAGITIFDALSKNQYYSLGNKFFDYMMAERPQVCVHYPEYAAILKDYKVAIPLTDTRPEIILEALNKLIENPVLYKEIQQNCKKAAEYLNWENEEAILLSQWDKLLTKGL